MRMEVGSQTYYADLCSHFALAVEDDANKEVAKLQKQIYYRIPAVNSLSISRLLILK